MKWGILEYLRILIGDLQLGFITIVNLVLNRAVIPEFDEAGRQTRELTAALLKLLTDPEAAAVQRAGLAEAVVALGANENPGEKAAGVVLELAEGPPRV